MTINLIYKHFDQILKFTKNIKYIIVSLNNYPDRLTHNYWEIGFLAYPELYALNNKTKFSLLFVNDQNKHFYNIKYGYLIVDDRLNCYHYNELKDTYKKDEEIEKIIKSHSFKNKNATICSVCSYYVDQILYNKIRCEDVLLQNILL